MGKYSYKRRDPRISVDEVSEMLDKTEDLETKACISILWITGARISEILSLQVNDIHLFEDDNKKYIRLRIRTLKQRKDGKPYYDIRFLEISRDTRFLAYFLNYADSKDKKTDKIFERYRELAYYHIKKTNPHLSPHAFRHSRCQKFADSVENVFKLMSVTGHKEISNVLKYVRTSQISTRELRDKYT